MFSQSIGLLADRACSARAEKLKSSVLTALLCVQTAVSIVDALSVRYRSLDSWHRGSCRPIPISRALDVSITGTAKQVRQSRTGRARACAYKRRTWLRQIETIVYRLVLCARSTAPSSATNRLSRAAPAFINTVALSQSHISSWKLTPLQSRTSAHSVLYYD